MTDLPIRKVGDALRVRDASGAVLKGVVIAVDADGGLFQVEMPNGHHYGSTGNLVRSPRFAWTFFRDETADYGLEILGPWIETKEPA